MAISKKTREQVYNKYGGKCAYCGCNLEKGWHIDHMNAVRRTKKHMEAYYKNKVTGEKIHWHEFNKSMSSEWEYRPSKWVHDKFTNPENDSIENYNPACASCNINKHQMDIEQFRQHIARFLDSLNNYHVQYRFAKKFGLIQETGAEVKFYFESLIGI